MTQPMVLLSALAGAMALCTLAMGQQIEPQRVEKLQLAQANRGDDLRSGPSPVPGGLPGRASSPEDASGASRRGVNSRQGKPPEAAKAQKGKEKTKDEGQKDRQ